MNVKTAVIVLYAVLSLLPWALVPLVPVLVVDAWAMLLAMLLLSLVSAVLTWGMVTTGVSRPGASRVGILALSSLSIMLIATAGALSSREDYWTGLIFLLLTPLHGALALWIALHARRAGPHGPIGLISR